jgi:hypothetical protein
MIHYQGTATKAMLNRYFFSIRHLSPTEPEAAEVFYFESTPLVTQTQRLF